jgi:hypothetical protein
MSSKLNKVRLDEAERFCGDDWLRSLPGERSDELEFLEVVPSDSTVGVDGAGELEELPITPPVLDTAMRPSGTW